MENKKNLEKEVGIMDLELKNFVDYFNLKGTKEVSAKYVAGLVGNLYSKDGKFYSRGIRTVRDLYTLCEDDIRRMSMYGRKTFLKLNELLTENGLPALLLPKEYTSSLQS
jgi:hypothetical protein